MMYLIKTLLHGFAVLIGISVVMFAVFFAAPLTDPAARLAGKGASPELLAQIRHQNGFDKSLPRQYLHMMRALFLKRNLTSYVHHGQNVVSQLTAAAPVTLSLVGVSAVITVIGCFTLGVGSAIAGEGFLAATLGAVSMLMVATPVFWLGEIVNMVTQGPLHDTWALRWVPSLGYTSFLQDPIRWFTGLLLPGWTLAVSFIGLYSRILRTELLGAMRSRAIRTAWAKGAGPKRVWLCHGLRLSLISILALFGMDFAQLVGGGALLVEVVFALPGVGHLTFEALNSFDLPLLLAVVMYSAMFIVIVQSFVDLMMRRLDPRIAKV